MLRAEAFASQKISALIFLGWLKTIETEILTIFSIVLLDELEISKIIQRYPKI